MVTIDQIIAEKIGGWYVGEWPIGNFFLCFIALILSMLLCGAIGIERESRGRTAGLRTHLLVGVGSCLIMIISIYGFPKFVYGEGTISRDVARLAAQVITGVGFLGAGAIIHRSSGAKGLTTAATIWAVMAIGLACGSMNFVLATVSTFLMLVVLITFRYFERRMSKRSPMVMLHIEKGVPFLDKLEETSKKYKFRIRDILAETDDQNHMEITFLAQSLDPEHSLVMPFLSALESIEGVLDVSTINSASK